MPKTNFWQQLSERSSPFVLVKIERVEGSSPREEGAKLLVSEQEIIGTIGGGHLEFLAIQKAQQQLAENAKTEIEWHPYPLVPKFDQCCGGRVTLSYELVTENTSWWQELKQLPLETWQNWQLVSDQTENRRYLENSSPGGQFDSSSKGDILSREAFAPARPKLYVFGAGHVARALFYHLAPLEIDLVCIDSRQDQLALISQPEVKKFQLDSKRPIAEQLQFIQNDSYSLVMTHSHLLDYELCHTLMTERQPQFLGLIGSKTKKKRFYRQFAQDGITEQQLNSLHCPIGSPNIQGKTPHLIALAVCQQIIQEMQTANRTENSNQEFQHYV